MNCSSNWREGHNTEQSELPMQHSLLGPGWPLISKQKSPGFHHTSHSKAGTSPSPPGSPPLFTPNSSPRSYGWLPTSFLGFLTPLQWLSTIPFILAPHFLWVKEFPNSQLEDHEGKEGNDWSCSYIGQPPLFVPSPPHHTNSSMREGFVWALLQASWGSGPKLNYLSSLRLYLFPDPDHILRERKATKKVFSFQMNHQGSATRRNSTCVQ